MEARIGPGSTVLVRDSFGVEHEMEAMSAIESDGHSFPVVWVKRPLKTGGSDRVPWPAEDVRCRDTGT